MKRLLKIGHGIADKIQATKDIPEIDGLSDEIKRYSDSVNEDFGLIDEFAEDENEKYSDLVFLFTYGRRGKGRPYRLL